MAEVIFNYEGIYTTIKCYINDKMKDIIKEFLIKINKQQDNNKLCYLYNGKRIKYVLTFEEQANDLDRNRKKMNILVTRNDGSINEIKQIISKDIICPICEENTLMDIQNFKIKFHRCKYNHEKGNITLYDYEETQKIDLDRIKCHICNSNNKDNTHNNNEYYICNTCNKNICFLCKSNHDNKHKIIKYHDKNYICKKHNESFIKYCKTCNENICTMCENEHKEHVLFELGSMLIDKEELLKINEELKIVIDKYNNKIEKSDIFKNNINPGKEIYEKMINILNIYYKINNEIINNYNISNINYHILQNLTNLRNSNKNIIKELINIINNDKISDIYEFALDNFYNENGEKYIGDFKNGVKEGKGILYYDKDDENERSKYEGDFKNDKQEGKGTLYFKNGNKYEGDFKDSKSEGKGIMYYNNNDRYEGNYKNGKREGKGIMYL